MGPRGASLELITIMQVRSIVAVLCTYRCIRAGQPAAVAVSSPHTILACSEVSPQL